MIILSTQPIRAQGIKKIGIDLTPGRVKDIDNKWSQKLLHELEGNLTAAGWEVVELTSITPDTLKGLDALVIGKMYNEQSGFSQAEVQAIADWFKQGGKFLWVGADSDYTEPYLNPEDTSFKSKEPNKILAAIGSHLRIDHMSIEDPDNNAGAAYRVVANRSVGGINDQGVAAKITEGVDRVLFHGPAGLAGYKDGKFVPVEEVFNEHVFWLCRTGPRGTVVSHDGVDPEAYSVGDTGRFYLAAAELIPTFSGVYSKVVVTAESIIGDRNIFISEYHGVSLDGLIFVLNVFKWGLQIEGLLFHLEIVSPIPIGGEGWYTKGETVTLSVTSPVYLNNDTRYIFLGWSGDISSSSPTVTITINSDMVVYANWKTQYYLKINTKYGSAQGGGWYDSGSTAIISIDEKIVDFGNNTRVVFVKWGGDIDTFEGKINIIVDKPINLVAIWKIQYYLDISSKYGVVEGEGWYDKGSTAYVNLREKGGNFLIKPVFKGWTGDMTSADKTLYILMDGPKKIIAIWEEDYTSLYLILIVILLFISGIAIGLYLSRKR